MCLIIFAYKVHPTYQLIMAANRDEFYQRPTRPAQWWSQHPEILAGKDLLAGGTWMGISATGRLAAITNYRGLFPEHKVHQSRGQLVLDSLLQPQEPQEFLETIDQQHDTYEGFNLLVGVPNQLYHYSNIERQITALSPGVYGLSNHLLDTPWPKVRQGKEALQKLLPAYDQDEMFAFLKDDSQPSDEELPETGVGIEWERILAPSFIRSEEYGTRSSSILTITYDGKVQFEERSHLPEAHNTFTFSLAPTPSRSPLL